MSRTAKEIETTGLPCEAQNGETIQVVPKINVTMFGKFTLKQEGMEVPHAVSLTGRSRRLWTLTAYLILNRNRGVSAQELIDLLWPEAENDNPLSTLQNNVSRARAALAELGFTHAKVIIHNEKGYYRWAPDRVPQCAGAAHPNGNGFGTVTHINLGIHICYKTDKSQDWRKIL